MATQRTVFFTAALNLLASAASKSIQQMEQAAHQLSSTIDGYQISQPTTQYFPINMVDRYAHHFILRDFLSDYYPFISSADGNCL